jgi:hypothetical protein
MRTLNVALAGIAGGVLGLCAAVPGKADIVYTGLGVEQLYTQTASGTSFSSSILYVTLGTQSASDFTSANVSVPGSATPISVPMSNTPEADGSFKDTFFSAPFTSSSAATTQATLNAVYPFGTYTFTATNSGTSASQTATLNYDANEFPTIPGGSATAVPTLTSGTYSALQGLNSANPQTLNFNNFTGDGVAPPGSGIVDPTTELLITNLSTGAVVYYSGSLADSATSWVLPAGTLQPGTTYQYSLDFSNTDFCGPGTSCDGSNPIGYALGFYTFTSGIFQTLAAAPAGTTTVNVAGGTLADPTPLVSEGNVGQIDGSIGGDGAEDFYTFYWAGGLFQADAELYGANASGEYQFELLNQFGGLLDEVTLDAADDFSADLSALLAAGPDYEIGLVADSTFDPNYSITFETPIGVPEPGTLGLLGAAGFSLAFIGIRRRRTQRA